MKNTILVAVLVIAACGGKNKNNAEEGGGATIDTQATSGDTTDHSGSMVPPEKMEEVNSALLRKNNIISRCLSQAVEAGTAPKGTHGKITVELSISPSGQATKVEVIKSSIESKEVQGCVKRKVEEISFPELPKQYETSYTYAMEAN
ncbi:MAG TPA: AgmX/PglI C-terminal domain-containing protein [Kofleriaceae bacterium]|nr:AgmX/PglI C-terminal domain-containing protein [Kofleriaceae bacterium]